MVARFPFRTFAPVLALTAMLLSAGSASAASQYILLSVEPQNKELAPGKVFNPGDTLTVPDGVTVTLLGEDGSVSPVAGPASVKITADGQPAADEKERRTAMEKIAGLLAGKGGEASTLGVARAFGVTRSAGGGDPWAAPTDRDGHVCQRGSRILLARGQSQTAATLSAKGLAGEAKELFWPAGKGFLSLPGGFRVGDGELEIRFGGDKPTLLMVHALPGAISENDPVAVLGWMAAQKCNVQALAFAQELAAKAK
jgi:hypothetical protein